MYKYILILGLLFSGCSHFKFNATMCDRIVSEPNSVIPQECRSYNEAETQKAFDKTKVKSSTSEKEDLEFKK